MAIKTYYLVKKFIDMRSVPFYVEDVSGNGGDINVYQRNGDATYVEYSTDLESWTKVDMGNSPYTPYAIIPISPAGRVYMRSVATRYYGAPNGTIISYDRTYNVGGNIMSMLYGSNFTGAETVFPNNTKNNIFSGFFASQSKLINASSLMLPATTLTQGCYSAMFYNCTSLTTPPALPATTLTQGCYSAMFYNCTSLTTAPALPATTLVPNCYYQMFYGCTALTTAPVLPATTLADNCYYQMFQNCTNLNSITVGATSWNTGYANKWVSGVSATGTFTKPTNTSIDTGVSGIPSGWTVVNV